MADPTPAANNPTPAAPTVDNSPKLAGIASDNTPAANPTPPATQPTTAGIDLGADLDAPKIADPNEGDYKLTMPEGVAVADTVREKIVEAAKSAGVTPKALQDLLNAALPAHAHAETMRIKSLQESWTLDTKADPEIGGAKLKDTLSNVNSVLAQYDAEGELTKLLNDSGLSKHRAILRVLSRVGAALKEDTIAIGRKHEDEERAFVEANPKFRKII